MNLNQKSRRLIQVTLTGGDVIGSLKKITEQNIQIYDIYGAEELSVRFSVLQKDLKVIKKIAKSRGDNLKQENIGYWQSVFHFIQSRFVFILSCIFILLLSIWIPTKIFFVEIQGNETIPDNLILEVVEKYGLYFGADRADIRSESMKISLLSEMEQLDWVGITTAGCVATVEVKEKQIHNDSNQDTSPVSSIIASCDGVIEEITATKGTPLCKVGQVVRKGQVLISAYEDCGFVIKAGRAKGEVVAQTLHDLNVVSPSHCTVRESEISLKTNYSVIIGKNIINFHNNSGISPIGCVKIYEQKNITLPGGFELPFTVVKETIMEYNTVNTQISQEHVVWMESISDSYLQSQIIAGTILQKKGTYGSDNACFLYQAQYICREQIGKNRIEETLNYYGKNS